jgi:hypothetical protein
VVEKILFVMEMRSNSDGNRNFFDGNGNFCDGKGEKRPNLSILHIDISPLTL